MDPSALIFVALAVAWAVYLIPKALEHHEESARTRTVDRFSKTMRVLGRREPVSRRKARLVAGSAPVPTSADADVVSDLRRSSHAPTVEATRSAEERRAMRLAAARAAKRRLRVVSLILLANAAVAGAAFLHLVGWMWCAVPVGVLVAWLVACRLMVKRERAEQPARRTTARIPAEVPADVPGEHTEEMAKVGAPVPGDEPATRAPGSWDPVSVPLPTYVNKAVAPRSVSTIDLDSTGVWSSGHSASDSALAREAEAEAAGRPAATDAAARRASGA